ncbi:MAG: LacI family transcriptional regulator [Mariniphaga sp.]|nr:LacI family transcriptional regulator [Mariniphaga sp.]
MKKHPEITIHHLAYELKISASTVSRALNDNNRISAKTRQMVQKKAIEMGYRPNILAANLRSKKTNTIGVVVPRIDRYFFSSAISGIEDYAWTKGFNVIISQSNDLLAKEINCVQTLFNNRVDGIIVSISMQTNEDKHFRLFSEKNIPILFFDRFCPTIESDRIVVDDYNSGYSITHQLINRGCRRIAHIAGPELLNIYKDRKNGYLKALTEAGLPVIDGYLEVTGLTKEEGIQAFARLMALSNPPDGVFCGNDTTALSALEYCRNNNLKVPDDVALFGFSDEPFSAVVTPSLSTVKQPGYQMGFQAAQKIIHRIENANSTIPYEQIVLPTTLIIRDSSR